MAVKVGDMVRYLNSVGGGRVVRVQGDMAYVDEDGFETPVLARECVVVGAPAQPKTSSPSAPKAAPMPSKDSTPAPTKLPVVETRTGDVLNLVLGFEASDLKALSGATFDAYFVNDSNYYIYLSLATKGKDDATWTPRYDGLIEPNIQEFLVTVEAHDLPRMDRMAVQYMAFKRGRDFEAKAPAMVELKVDTTKFAKLHCFRPNPYFDVPVISFDVAVADKACTPAPMPDLSALKVPAAAVASKKPEPRKQPSRSSKPSGDVMVVDLHASELVDTTAGLSPADILNLQIDHFSRVMDRNLRNIGQKIVFIHGKGEGVLRQAIMKELNHRYKGHDVQDASFREYGFGATQVTIRPVKR